MPRGATIVRVDSALAQPTRPFAGFAAGDLVAYQTERMLEERMAVVLAVRGIRLDLDDRGWLKNVGAGDFVRHLRRGPAGWQPPAWYAAHAARLDQLAVRIGREVGEHHTRLENTMPKKTFRPRSCEKCGGTYTPTGTTQRLCTACGQHTHPCVRCNAPGLRGKAKLCDACKSGGTGGGVRPPPTPPAGAMGTSDSAVAGAQRLGDAATGRAALPPAGGAPGNRAAAGAPTSGRWGEIRIVLEIPGLDALLARLDRIAEAIEDAS